MRNSTEMVQGADLLVHARRVDCSGVRQIVHMDWIAERTGIAAEDTDSAEDWLNWCTGGMDVIAAADSLDMKVRHIGWVD